MIEIEQNTGSAEFLAAVHDFTQASTRDELTISQIDAPAKLAKEAIAFAADVSSEHIHDNSDHGTGRLVLLHEPTPNPQWGGNFRIIVFAKSPLETHIGADEEISDVAWAWLMEALHNRGAEFSHEAGTTTRIISSGFGSLAGQSDHAELEMRSSWSPIGSLTPHLEAWQDLICMMSGHPLFPQDVTPLHGRNRR